MLNIIKTKTLIPISEVIEKHDFNEIDIKDAIKDGHFIAEEHEGQVFITAHSLYSFWATVEELLSRSEITSNSTKEDIKNAIEEGLLYLGFIEEKFLLMKKLFKIS